MLCKQGLSEVLHDHKSVFKGEFVSTRKQRCLWDCTEEEEHLLFFTERSHKWPVAFHSELNTVLNLPSVPVALLPREISKSNRLLISPYLFSISVENWLSRGVWHRELLEEGGGGVIHCWNKACLNFYLQSWQERSLKRESVFHLIFMCVIWKMLLQLWSSLANYLKHLQRLQLQMAKLPGRRLT